MRILRRAKINIKKYYDNTLLLSGNRVLFMYKYNSHTASAVFLFAIFRKKPEKNLKKLKFVFNILGEIDNILSIGILNLIHIKLQFS